MLKLPRNTINVITNHNNPVGMHRDRILLTSILEELGYQVTHVHYEYREKVYCPDAYINIMIEPFYFTFPYFKKAKKNWVIVNLEGFCPDLKDYPDLLFLAKTQHCYDALKRVGLDAFYIGFYATDFFDSSVKRQRRFIHIKGKSPHKNTEAVLKAWQRLDYPLTLVSSKDYPPMRNVNSIKWAKDEEIKQLQNSHLFHLCPSSCEGFGHFFHEAHGVGAVIVSTDAPPMDEWASAVLVKPVKSKLLANKVNAKGIVEAAHTCMDMSEEEINQHSQRAREFFLPQREQFKERMKILLETH